MPSRALRAPAPFRPVAVPDAAAGDGMKVVDDEVIAKKMRAAARAADVPAPRLTDFYAHLPTHQYIHVPTRELWPASSVDGSVQPWPKGSNNKDMSPSRW